MKTQLRPPAWAEHLIQRVMPNDTAAHGVIGDLREEYALRVQRRSRVSADLWLWWQAFAIYVRFRIEGRPTPRRPRPYMIDQLRQDIRYALRTLVRRPGFAIIVILTLSIAIGANTAIFSIVNGVLLRPLPYPDAARLVRLLRTYQGEVEPSVSYLNTVDWREQATVFDALAIYRGEGATLTGVAEPEILQAGHVSAQFFRVLGITPHLGRFFQDGDAASAIVVLSYDLWRRKFGSDSSVVGTSVTLDESPYTVIGVTPHRFGSAMPGWENRQLWIPLVAASFEQRRSNRSVYAVARMLPDVTIQEVQDEMSVISARLGSAYPEARVGGARVVSLHEQLAGEVRRSLLTFLGAVSLVLCIAIANVTNLTLGRATDRRQELVLRAALGAGRRRLIRQLLTESVLLASVGGALGLGLSVLFTRLVVRLSAESIPLVTELRVDASVLAFTLGTTVLAGLLVGAVPALRATTEDLGTAVKGQRSFVQGSLVVAEVALALVLFVGAGLLTKSFWRLTHEDLGIEAAHTLTFRLVPPSSRYSETAQLDTFFDEVLSRLRGLPGVRAVSAAHNVPLDGRNTCGQLYAVGQPPPPPESDLCAEARAIRSGYFRAMGIPLLRGRTFTDADNSDAPPVVIINQTLSDLLWPTEDPAGKMMYTGFSHPVEVVGVVRDAVNRSLDEAQPPQTYLPWAQWTWRQLTVVVRTAETDPTALMPMIRQIVRTLDDTIPLSGVSTMEEYVARSVATPRFRTMLLGSFAAMALLLAIIGIYGVLSHSVAQRNREIAIRIALGAGSPKVVRLVLKQGIAMVATGIIIGLAAALALTRLLSSFLFEVEPTDAVTLVALTVAMFTIALGAMYLPSRRATRADPLVALKHE